MGIDAIIVGAGAAGLTAALRAATRHARVLLLEHTDGSQSDLAKSGGSTSAAGTRQQAAAGVADSAASWAEDIVHKTNGCIDETVMQVVTGRSREMIDFLNDEIGIPIHLVQKIPVVGHRCLRLHATPSESGRELAGLLDAAIARQSGIVRVNDAEVTGLVDDSGRIAGVSARVDGREQTILAPFTLLTCGGFAANKSMLREYIPEVAAGFHIGCPANRGCGIVWAQQRGATTAFMDSYQGHGHVTADGRGRLGFGLTSLGAILVDSNGCRFVREDIGPSELAAHVLAAPGGTAVEIYDQQAHEAALRLAVYRDVVEMGNACRASSIEELANLFELPRDTLTATLAAYDRFAAGEGEDPLQRRAYVKPLRFPLWGARITGALAHTQGGVRVDAAARVMRADGTTIPGLLAAGGTVVGISGHGAAGYASGNGLAQAFTLGMVAADTIARQASAMRAQLVAAGS